MPGRRLCREIPGRKRQRLVAHGIGLGRVVGTQAHASELDPQERIVRLDPQCALDGSRGLPVVPAVRLGVGLRDERARGGTEPELSLRRGVRRWRRRLRQLVSAAVDNG